MRALHTGWIACLFFLVLGARWAVVDQFGTDLPQWDQWDAEAMHVLVPWYGHDLSVDDFLRPQNEHRVILTKLLNLGLTVADGQWDERLECAVNAGLAALFAVGVFAFGLRHLPARWHLLYFLLVAAILAPPIAWHNVVAGFHSQQFFLLGLSFGAIVWLPLATPGSGRWWLGAGCAVLALGSMGSGFFAAAVVAALVLLRIWHRALAPARAIPTLALCAGAIAVGWLSRVTVSWHEALKAQSVTDFYLTVLHGLQWPLLRPAPVHFACLLWVPWVLLAIRQLLAKKEPDRDALGLAALGLGGWVILQIIATGYARGAGGLPPASRYVDTLDLGAVANGLALAWLGRDATGRRSVGAAALAVVWIAAFGTGYGYQLRSNLASDLPTTHRNEIQTEDTVRNYLATKNRNYLLTGLLPYPGVDGFLERLERPELSSLMPASVRRPLALVSASSSPTMIRLDTRVPRYAASEALTPPKPVVPTGLSPQTTALENRVSWGSFGSFGEWSSAPVTPTNYGWLKFEVAGQLGAAGTIFELRSASTHELLAKIVPSEIPGERWRAAYARMPRQDFVLTARTQDSAHWFAFSEPVELGTLSYWARRAVQLGKPIAVIALVTALLLFGVEVYWRQSGTATSPIAAP